KERGKVTGVGVPQIARGAVVHGNEERGEAVVTGVAHQMFVQTRDQLRSAQSFAAGNEHLAAQRRLQTGHQQRGGNSFSGNVGNRDGQVRWSELDEIVVVAADFARRFADGFKFRPRNVRQDSRE